MHLPQEQVVEERREQQFGLVQHAEREVVQMSVGELNERVLDGIDGGRKGTRRHGSCESPLLGERACVALCCDDSQRYDDLRKNMEFRYTEIEEAFRFLFPSLRPEKKV